MRPGREDRLRPGRTSLTQVALTGPIAVRLVRQPVEADGDTEGGKIPGGSFSAVFGQPLGRAIPDRPAVDRSYG